MSHKAFKKNSDFEMKRPKYFGLRLTPWTHLVWEIQVILSSTSANPPSGPCLYGKPQMISCFLLVKSETDFIAFSIQRILKPKGSKSLSSNSSNINFQWLVCSKFLMGLLNITNRSCFLVITLFWFLFVQSFSKCLLAPCVYLTFTHARNTVIGCF